VLAYATSGDRGGGAFHYDVPSTSTDDGGSVIKPTAIGGASPGRWIADGLLKFNAARFGVVADGNGTTGTDNSPQLCNMGRYLCAHNGCEVTFPPGIMCLTDNSWSNNIRDVTFDFEGCKVQCTVTGGGAFQTSAVNLGNNIATNQRIGTLGQTGPVYSRINSVAKGSVQVTTTTAGDAANLTPGSWAVVLGYDHQGPGNFPYNMRFVDYVKVVSINAKTGVVVIDRPLRHFYRSDWYPLDWASGPFPSVHYTLGAANILNLDRGDLFQFADYLCIKNCESLTNPLDTTPADANIGGSGINFFGSNNISIYGARHARLENCVMQNSFCGDSDLVEVINCNIGEFQPDKNTNKMSIRGGRVHFLAGCQGYNELVVEGAEISYAISSLPRRLWVSGCRFSHPACSVTSSSQLYMEYASITDNVFEFAAFDVLSPGRPMNVTSSAPDQPGPQSITVTSVGSGHFNSALGTGFRISGGPGTILRRVTDGARFIVTDIRYVSGANENIVDYTSASTPVAGDVLYYNAIVAYKFIGNKRSHYPNLPWVNGYTPAEEYVDDHGYGVFNNEFVFDFLSDGPRVTTFNFQADGYVEEVIVDVVRAYSGAGGGGLRIQQRALFTGTGITPSGDITINTAHTGYRDMTTTTATGAQAGDVNVVALARTLVPAVYVDVNDTDNNGVTGFKGRVAIKVSRRR
jgi:hypothetical protein